MFFIPSIFGTFLYIVFSAMNYILILAHIHACTCINVCVCVCMCVCMNVCVPFGLYLVACHSLPPMMHCVAASS